MQDDFYNPTRKRELKFNEITGFGFSTNRGVFDILLALGFSQAYLADRLKVKEHTVWKWMLGEFIPKRYSDQLRDLYASEIEKNSQTRMDAE